jgi:hypothetical protein
MRHTMSRERKLEWADWIADTCLHYGTSVHTAFHVAALFVEAIEHEGLCEDVGVQSAEST